MVRNSAARRRLAATLGLSLSLVALTGCGSDGTVPEPATASPTEQAAALTITDAWVKAADSGMTAAFGVLHNDSDSPVTIVSASSEVATMVELHETVADDSGQMVMRPVTGGVEVPPGGEHELAPGGDHIMLMEIVGAIEPGDEIEIILAAEDGSTLTVTAPGRTFAGANETYDGGATMPAPDTENP